MSPDPNLSHLRLPARLAARTAHDLNNALAIFMGHLYFLREGSESVEEAADAMEMATQNLMTLSRSLAALGALSMDDVVRVDVNETVLAVIETRGLRGVVDHDLTDGLPAVSAPREDLTSAVEALLVNASEASRPEQRVRVATRLDPAGAVEIRVEDSGEGVSEQVLRRGFEPLFSTRGVKGRGIGITLAATVASQSGGSLTIEPRSEGGTRATIHLPPAEL